MFAMKYSIPENVISTALDENESVILHLNTQKYYSLNETGTVIWNCLDNGKSFKDIVLEIEKKL